MELIYFTASDFPAGLHALIDSTGGSMGSAGLPLPPYGYDPDNDDGRGWLLAQGEPLAYAWLERQTPGRGWLEIGVAPQRRRQGLGRRLLAEAMRQASEWELQRLIGPAPAGEATAAAFAAIHGFAAVGSCTALVAAADLEAPAVKIAGDYFLSRFSDYRHLPTLSALLVRAYRDRPGRPESEHGAVTVERLETDLQRHPGDEFFIVLDAVGKGVGVVRARADNRIDAPGLVAEERSQALQLPLIAAALRHLHNGRPRGMLAFDPGPADLEDYRKLGFRIAAQKTLFRKDL